MEASGERKTSPFLPRPRAASLHVLKISRYQTESELGIRCRFLSFCAEQRPPAS